MNIENDLREALARTSPPPGFAARVMDAIEHEPAPRISPGRTAAGWSDWWRRLGQPSTPPVPARRRPRLWQWAAAAALLMAIGGGTTAHYYIERQREGERAKEQVLLALHITSAKLRGAREHVRAIAKQEE